MFRLRIITAEKSLYEGDVKMLTLPTVNGEIGILTNHHPIVAELSLGALKIKKEDDSEQIIFVAGGFLEVNSNVATVLADTAENLEDIEMTQATAARKKAEDLLKTAKKDVDKDAILQEIRLHQMRERLADIGKYKK